MENKIDFWVIEEINRLEKDIMQRQELIDKLDLEIKEKRLIRDLTFKDYAIAINKYGSKKSHEFFISCCNKRIYMLKNNVFKNKEEYYGVGIFL